MPLSTDAVFPQAFYGKSVACTAAVVVTTPTNPATPVEILAAAANVNGAIVTKLTAIPTATSAANVLGLWISYDGGTTKHLLKQVTAAADTSSGTDPAAQVDFGYSKSDTLDLPAGASLYVGILTANPTNGWHFTIAGRLM